MNNFYGIDTKQEPSPYRCDLCGYLKNPKGYDTCKGYCHQGKVMLGIEYFPVYSHMWSFTELFGCTKHSELVEKLE
jgi:hypothetical protein